MLARTFVQCKLQRRRGAKCESGMSYARREIGLERKTAEIRANGTIFVSPKHMTLIATFSDKLPGGAPTKALIRGIAAFASAEFAVRLVRLLAVIVMAQRLSPQIIRGGRAGIDDL